MHEGETVTSEDIIEAIRIDTRRGWVIHPLHGPNDKCNSPGKQPWLENWQMLTRTPEDIGTYITQKGANIGLVCGRASGVDGIDQDHEYFIDELFDGVGELNTLMSAHRPGRRHILFQHEEDMLSAKHHFIGIEYFANNEKGAGSNIVLPPSIHPTGEQYNWKDPNAPLMKMPERLKENLRDLFKREDDLHRYFKKCRPCFTNGSRKYPKEDPRSKGLWERPDSVAMHGMDGRRAVLAILGELKAAGCHDNLLLMCCKRLFGKDYEPIKTKDELSHIEPIHPTCKTLRQYLNVDCEGCNWKPRGTNKAQSRPRHESCTDIGKFNLTDLGNAQRLVALHGKDMRFCHPWSKWLIWDGKRWQPDATGEADRRAKDVVRSLYAEAARIKGDDDESQRERRRLVNFALSCECPSAINNMLELASSEPDIPVLPHHLDANKWLLNVMNGTINLRTGKLLEHARENFCTKIAQVAYDPRAGCPMWLEFLNKIFHGNKDTIRFVQKAIGYSLIGDMREQCIFILYGTGSNGKSTFVFVVSFFMGDYACQAQSETLFTKKYENRINNDVARLKGVRFISVIESEGNKRLAESLIKQWTGEDKITTRFLYQEYFEFMPEGKIFLATNHKPVIRGTDHAIWRRIRLVPFKVTIPDNEQDKELRNKLLAELPGILNWALEGCLLWQKEGLDAPEEVRQATRDYREEMDILGEFLNSCCEIEPSAFIPNKMLYLAYQLWCEAGKENALSHRNFPLALEERGFKKEKKEVGRIWHGLRLNQIVMDIISVTEKTGAPDGFPAGCRLMTDFRTFSSYSHAQENSVKKPSEPSETVRSSNFEPSVTDINHQNRQAFASSFESPAPTIIELVARAILVYERTRGPINESGKIPFTNWFCDCYGSAIIPAVQPTDVWEIAKKILRITPDPLDGRSATSALGVQESPEDAELEPQQPAPQSLDNDALGQSQPSQSPKEKEKRYSFMCKPDNFRAPGGGTISGPPQHKLCGGVDCDCDCHKEKK